MLLGSLQRCWVRGTGDIMWCRDLILVLAWAKDAPWPLSSPHLYIFRAKDQAKTLTHASHTLYHWTIVLAFFRFFFSLDLKKSKKCSPLCWQIIPYGAIPGLTLFPDHHPPTSKLPHKQSSPHQIFHPSKLPYMDPTWTPVSTGSSSGYSESSGQETIKNHHNTLGGVHGDNSMGSIFQVKSFIRRKLTSAAKPKIIATSAFVGLSWLQSLSEHFAGWTRTQTSFTFLITQGDGCMVSLIWRRIWVSSDVHSN